MGGGLWARGARTVVRIMWRFRSEVSKTCPGPLPGKVTSKDCRLPRGLVGEIGHTWTKAVKGGLPFDREGISEQGRPMWRPELTCSVTPSRLPWGQL